LEIPGKTQLVELDDYLRAIWLECCGHLSQFSIGGWSGDEIPMTARVADVFGPDLEVTHIYDFGTSSITSIKAISTREGKFLPSKPIALMARNLQPESSCIECDEPANWFCLECMIEDQVYGTLCDRHVKTHPHEDYEDPIPLVNSPRLGMCGYTGPADPPY
jgi:hypothetical protein